MASQQHQTESEVVQRLFGESVFGVDIEKDIGILTFLDLHHLYSSTRRRYLFGDEPLLKGIINRAYEKDLGDLCGSILGLRGNYFADQDATEEPMDLLPELVKPELIWCLFSISATQIEDKILTPWFSKGLQKEPWSDHCPQQDWAKLNPKKTYIELREPLICWMEAVMELVCHLSYDKDFEMLGRDTCLRCDTIFRTLIEQTSSSAHRAKAIFESFKDICALIDDVAYVMKHDETELATVQRCTSRHTVLCEIVANASTVELLPTAVATLVDALPDDERECAICTSSWSADVLPQDLSVDHESWLSISAEKTVLIVQPGHERVPLRLPCGHIFCADCVKKWMRDGRIKLRQCPYRDLDFGLWRPSVLKVEEVGKKYGLGRG